MSDSVILVQPGYRARSFLERIATSTLPPLGLLTIAACLERAGYRVRVFDFNVEPRDGRLLEAIRAERPAFLGLSTLASVAGQVGEIVQEVRAAGLDVPIVVGGYDATERPEHYLRQYRVDCVLRGEGEETVVELLRRWPSVEGISGLSYLRDGEAVHHPPTPRLTDLDALPWPARHLVDLRRYRLSPGYRKYASSTSLFANRGCPHQCTFCDQAVFGRSMTWRSPKSIVDEMQYLVREHGARDIRIHDDVFNVNPKRSRELLEEMIRRDLGVSWHCADRVDHVTPELLELMHAAGCYRIEFGLEAGTPRILELIKKGKHATLERAEQAFRWTQEAGIEVLSNFILGFPTETLAEMEETIRVADAYDPDFAAFFLFQPYPGSPVARELELPWNDTYGRFERDDLPDIYPVPTSEILALVARAYRSFYLKPKRIARFVWRTRSASDLLSMGLVAMSMVSKRGDMQTEVGAHGAPRLGASTT